jgi:hypothetical protein
LLYHVSVMSPVLVFLVLWTCHLLGNAIGFLLSACFRTAEAAIFMIPFVILPMVAFSGALVSPAALPKRLAPIVEITPLYQGYAGLLGSCASVCIPVRGGIAAGKVDKSFMCGLAKRTVAPPPSDLRGVSFVEAESSCLNYNYEATGLFSRNNGLPVPPSWVDPDRGGDLPVRPDSGDDFVGSQLNPRVVARSIGSLFGLAIVLHLVALHISRRRMRTL